MLRINPTHKAADAFWRYWEENGEKHGYYESTWGAINAALQAAGLKSDNDSSPKA